MAIPSWVDTAHFSGGDEDITAYGRDAWTTTRGTTQVVQTGFIASAGQYTNTLDNLDRRFDPNYTAGPYYPDVLPQVAFDKVATYAATPYDVFTGNVDQWPQSYPAIGVDQTTEFTVSDAVKDFSEAAQISLTRPAEYTGARIQAVITAMGWPGAVSIAHGQGRVKAIKKSGGPISVWSHLSDCAQAEYGDIYIDGDGTLVFRDRATIATESRSIGSQATFSDTSSTLKYADITMANLPIVNHCPVTYGANGKTVTYQDATSITAYGQRSLPLNTILQSQSAAKQYARWVVTRYKDPLIVPASITFKPQRAETTLFPQVLGRKLSDLVTVVRTPRVNGVASTAISTLCWIRGIQHNYSNHFWQSTTFYLQEATWIVGLFILGSSSIGGTDKMSL